MDLTMRVLRGHEFSNLPGQFRLHQVLGLSLHPAQALNILALRLFDSQQILRLKPQASQQGQGLQHQGDYYQTHGKSDAGAKFSRGQKQLTEAGKNHNQHQSSRQLDDNLHLTHLSMVGRFAAATMIVISIKNIRPTAATAPMTAYIYRAIISKVSLTASSPKG